MNWFYEQPVKIFFGNNSTKKLPELIRGRKALLAASPHFIKNGTAEELAMKLGDCAVFGGISPNPDAAEVNKCAEIIRSKNIECIIALGGGSVIDLAKAASLGLEDISGYIGKNIGSVKGIPIIAVPTTSGTGSEVTGVAVISDRKKGIKAPIVSESFYPEYAVIDPMLTYSTPPDITASAGIDVLCHAVEGYWSKNHQPICDSLGFHAIRLVFEYLPLAYKDGDNGEAREKMAEASVIAGLAFTQPKTTAPHACSFPLTSIYGIPHGEACGLTLDYFARVNNRDERTKKLALGLGFADVNGFAERIARMREELSLRSNLKEFDLSDADVAELAEKSKHPNLLNNPVEITDEILFNLYNHLR